MMTLFDDETIMRNHDARIRREGRAEGRTEGRKEGRTEGVESMAKLMSWLLSAGRINDAARVTADPEYREKLFTELGINK